MANSRLCSIDNCDNDHYAKDFCRKHYERLKAHGDPLVGRGTPHGVPLRFLRDVVLRYQGDDCLTWPFCANGAGYGEITVEGKKRQAHRYICTLVHGEPPTPEHEAAHSCGRGHEACVAPCHLSWKTHTGNQADRVTHGTHDRGERSANAKLTEEQVRQILTMKGTRSQRDIAAEYGVTGAAISEIYRGRNWAWLTQNPPTS